MALEDDAVEWKNGCSFERNRKQILPYDHIELFSSILTTRIHEILCKPTLMPGSES